jgi:hypothetical protein
MFTNRISIALLSIIAFSAFQGVAASAGSGAGEQQSAKSSDGPVLGTWEFTGKDNTGLGWTGTLTIEKFDLARYGPKKYHSMWTFKVDSTDPNRGGPHEIMAPCDWDPGTRTVSFGNTWPATNVYTAVLSADGKVLTQGKWTESKFVRGQVAGVIRTGDWSAKLK